jgi:hypothetical protein
MQGTCKVSAEHKERFRNETIYNSKSIFVVEVV